MKADDLAAAFETLPQDWAAVLPGWTAERRAAVIARVRAASADRPIAPDDPFRALRLVAPGEVRAVILGQDPYHRPGQAHGLAFSVPDGCAPLPPSLRNIRAELLSDLGLAAPASGSLAQWADHGVLLLNTALTVREGSPGSHGRSFWGPFIAGAIAAIADKEEPVAFLVWGRHAQGWARLIDGDRHPLVPSAHPSPLSARRGFLGSRPFSRANAALAERGAAPVDWSLA